MKRLQLFYVSLVSMLLPLLASAEPTAPDPVDAIDTAFTAWTPVIYAILGLSITVFIWKMVKRRGA